MIIARTSYDSNPSRGIQYLARLGKFDKLTKASLEGRSTKREQTEEGVKGEE